MKRALSLIVVLAMVLAMVPAVIAADETLLTLTDHAVTADAPYVFEWTATADGTVKVNASPAFSSGKVNACWKATIYSTKGGEAVYEEGSYQTPGDMWMTPNTEYAIKKGQHLVLTLGAQKGYVDADGTISATVTFGGATVQKVKEAWDDVYGVSGTDLTQTTDLTLVENAEWTKFIFTPAAIGEYTLSVDSGVIVYCGANTAYCPVPGTASTATSTSITREIKSVGNSVIFAIKGDNTNVKLTVAKTGDSEGIVEHEYIPWENKHTPNADTVIPGGLEKIDITQAQTVVKISDSEYRLGSENGPIIYVDLETSEWSMAEALPGAFTVRAEYEGGYYNFRAPLEQYSSGAEEYQYGMAEYYSVMSQKGGMYPLTTDLVAFIKGWGGSQGWFTPSMSWFEAIQSGDFNEDSAWLVVALTDPASVKEEVPEVTLESGDYLIKGYGTEYYAGAHNGKKDIAIAAEADAVVYTVTVADNGTATILDPNGKYMGWTSGNAVAAMDTAFAWTVTAGENGYIFACDDGARYMAINGGEYWRTYAKSTVETNSNYNAEFELIPYVAPEPVPGESAENPILLLPDDQGNFAHTTEAQTAGTPVYYAANRVQGYVLNVTGEGDFTVTFGSNTYTAVNGVVTIDPFSAPNNYTPAIIAIDGAGTLNINIEPPKGTWDNPDELKIGENSATLEKNSMGYNWTYTAEEDGTLIFTVDPAANTSGYSISATNGTTYANVTLDLDNGLTKGELAVSAGDVVSVSANTLDLNSWDLPAGTVIFNVEKGHECVDSDGPDYEYFDDWSGYDLVEYCDICKEEISRETWYMIQDQDDSINGLQYTTVSVAAGESINLAAGYAVASTTMTLVADNATVEIDGVALTANNGVYTYEGFSFYGSEIVITNNGSAAATYELAFALPLGIYDNPEAIVPGESYEQTFATADDAWNGYYYSFTTDCPGILVLDFAGETWSYVIEDANWNQTYGDNCLGDNGHVEIAVNAGDAITVMLSSTADDGSGWSTGAAGTSGFTANFVHGVEGLPVLEEGVAAGDHSFGMKTLYNCEGCGLIFDAEGNEITEENIDSIILMPLHIDTMEEKEEVKATTETEGMKEHIHCSKCDKYFVLDENAEEYADLLKEVTKASLIIPKTATPATGDTFALVAVVALVVLSAMGIATIVVLKKRKTA